MADTQPTPLTFSLLSELGRGASAAVWQARTETGEPLAVKLGHVPEAGALLAHEAERLLAADSPALPLVRGLGRLPRAQRGFAAGTPYLALELLPRARRRSLGLEQLLELARVAGRALADLHAAGYAHGDVKPEHFVGEGEQLRLVDLGLASDADARLPRGGTPRYLAPELLQPGHGSDGRQRDGWALGLSLTELFEPSLSEASVAEVVAAAGRLPAPLDRLVVPLLASSPWARPSAAWVEQRASDALGKPLVDRDAGVRALRRSYLRVRRRELRRAAGWSSCELRSRGEPRRWLEAALWQARALRELRAAPAPEGQGLLPPLQGAALDEWLVELVGPSASSWPHCPHDEEQLSRLLGAQLALRPATSLRWDTLARPAPSADYRAESDVALALRLQGHALEPALLDELERRAWLADVEPALALTAVRRLRLQSEGGRALALALRLPGAAARAEAAETARRAGEPALAQRLLEGAPLDAEPDTAARLAATTARLHLDAGELDQAEACVSSAPERCATLEALALVAHARGQLTLAREHLEHAARLSLDDEELARLDGLRGYLAHAAGEPELALAAFARAEQRAARLGASLEEATWATGLASASVQRGELSRALEAARRAGLLFQQLGRPALAARAALTRAVVHTSLGMQAEAELAIEQTLHLARQGGDRRCRAYAHLCAVDLAEAPRHALLELERAEQLLGSPEDDEAALLLDACRLRLQGLGPEQLAAGDARALRLSPGAEAALEWWHARARRALLEETPRCAAGVVAALLRSLDAPAPLLDAGAAWAQGARLAAALADGEGTRALRRAARRAHRALLERAGPSLREPIAALPWALDEQPAPDHPLSDAQLRDLEALLRGLGRRDGLGPLLRQVLDTLVLWTGVERGLLLLRAPGGRLVPRLGRNLERGDLGAAQRQLSMSLAERALREGAPVVAVDASGELPELHASVHQLSLRSVLAVPLIARGEGLGVVYLDDRQRRGAFGPRELAWVRLVASVTATAIDDARAQLLLERALRRSARAEARARGRLAEREAELSVAQAQLSQATAGRGTRGRYVELIGESPPLLELLRLLDRLSLVEVPVLIVGESGSGKELVARALHEHGPRRQQRFVAENCGALPEGLLEASLFGHARGAFTGAVRARAGLFELASGGTLLLDELGEMSPALQVKLLRVLERGEITPLGAERPRPVDVRVLGATHRDLHALVQAGRFREDLLYRLDVFTLKVPPLRARRDDIPLLIRHFLHKHAPDRSLTLTPEAELALMNFTWPGNVRQLENELRRAIVLAEDRIESRHLSRALTGDAVDSASDGSLHAAVSALETRLIREALARAGGNRTRAAELLGVSRYGLQKMLKRLSLTPN